MTTVRAFRWLPKGGRHVAVDHRGAPVRAGDLVNQVGALCAAYNGVISPGNRTRVGSRRVSSATVRERHNALITAVRDLRGLGMALRDLRNLKQRHVLQLVEHWHKAGRATGTIQTRLSALRALAHWLGKPDIVPPSHTVSRRLGISLARQLAAELDKSWEAARLEVAEVAGQIAQTDPAVAVLLRLQRAFGLRIKEAALLRPCDIEDRDIHLRRGAKGGRQRRVPIETEEQLSALAAFRQLCPNQNTCLIPRTQSWAQFRNRAYYLLRRHGVGRKEKGTSTHGLRHERLQEIYTRVSGQPAPVKQAGQGPGGPADDASARLQVAEVAGHSREAVADAYLGAPRAPRKRYRNRAEHQADLGGSEGGAQ